MLVLSLSLLTQIGVVFILNFFLSHLGLPPIIPPIAVAECENSSSSEESDRPSCSTSTRTHRAERDFDLNHTPSPVEEEEDLDLNLPPAADPAQDQIHRRLRQGQEAIDLALALGQPHNLNLELALAPPMLEDQPASQQVGGEVVLMGRVGIRKIRK